MSKGLEASAKYFVTAFDDYSLIGLVMTLTGASANPEVIKHHIDRLRNDYKNDPK